MSINRRGLLGAGAAAGAALISDEPAQAAERSAPQRWTHTADLVVVGAGASGVVAAIAAREAGASVILLEAEPHAGGHAICSGGNMPLGGGTSLQKKYGVEDSPDLLFRDLTDWTVVEANGAADYRFNDREIIRAFADHSAATFEFLVAHGVVFVDKAPDNFGGSSVGGSVPREAHAAPVDWPLIQTGKPADPAVRLTMSTGNGLMHPLIAAAKKAGVQILLEHRMTGLHRRPGGRVTGVSATHKGARLEVQARKAVVLGTGGSSSNIGFRRMFNPNLTEEYCGVAGTPWSYQDASGELAGMAVGASLWGLANQTGEFGSAFTKAGQIGTRYGYVNLTWEPGSEVFDRAGAIGLRVRDWQNVILVNMIGNRFYDETGTQYAGNNAGSTKTYVQGSWRNAADQPWKPQNFLAAAMAGIGDGKSGGGPIWAIFDAEAAAREKWITQPPHVDIENGYFFSADTLTELARKIVNPYQRVPMSPQNLDRTVARYNGFVDTGKDNDFGKPQPAHKIAKGPFYAAWSTPVIHDTRAGLRIDGRCRVMDMDGRVIEGLYCGGETAGGFSQHGLARATCQGFIAGHEAAGAKAI
jgi:succinate dehydrogenase/fumarate reductase flavoprotein subunit